MVKTPRDASAKAANIAIAKEGETNQRKSKTAKSLPHKSGTQAGNQSSGGPRNAASRGHDPD
ncbi:MAG: hypothetical protein RIS17_1440 [Pseudomonadota bacterium]|jgi:hypothetical protein